MQRNTRSLVITVIALSLMALGQIASQANTFSRVVINGRYHLNSIVATGLNVNAYQTYYTATGVTVPGGSVTITSDVLSIHAAVASVLSDTICIAGKTYKHATVTSASFTYQGQAAHVIVEMAPCTLYGEAGFKVIRDSDGVLLTQSMLNDAYLMVPLEWGGMSIM